MAARERPRGAEPRGAAHGPRSLGRDERARRRSRRVGTVGFLLAAALPVWLWHDVVADIYRANEPDWRIAVVGWAPWTLMAIGLLCFVPVAVADLRDRERRFYRNSMAAWAGWGVTLYLLGFALATQVAQIHSLHAA